MEIGALPRAQALQALGRQQQRALSQGNTALVETLYGDLVTLQRARGATVEAMAERAERRNRRVEWLGTGLPVVLLGGAGLLGGAVAGVTMAEVTPLWAALFDGALLGGLAGAMVGALVAYSAVDLSDPGRPVLEALERCGGLLQAELQQPTPEISRTEILDQLSQDKERFAETGDRTRVRQTRRAARYFDRNPELELGRLYCWARTNHNRPTIASLETVLNRQSLRQLLVGETSPVDLSWLPDEVLVGDQSLPIDQA